VDAHVPTPLWRFVRHGESVANREGFLAGHDDVALTDEGRAAARALGRHLADVPIALALSSDLRRARETMQAILAGRTVPRLTSSALRERDAGAWTGRTIASIPEDEREAVMHSWDVAPPGGESLRQVAARSLGWLSGLRAVPGPLLIVGHGGALRAVLGALDGLSGLSGPHRQLIGNTEVLVRDPAAGDWASWRPRAG
jgi:broad specificity phosphatase PhoE